MTDAERQDNFDRWFLDSKVVDSAGTPRVVYHGTLHDIHQFDLWWALGPEDEQGFYFSSDPVVCDDFADVERGNVMPVYLSIKNLFVVEAWDWECGHPDLLKPVQAQKLGYDGYMIRGHQGGDTYIVFQSEQIKSAIGNSGAYDPSDPDITDRKAAASKALDFLSSLATQASKKAVPCA